MKTYKIINFFANSNDCRRVWQPLRRYFRILDNHLRGKNISLVEKENHHGNHPRFYYLEQISKGFGLDIDFKNPLFEGRVNFEYGEMYYKGNNFAIPRFFRRLDEAKRAGLILNEKVILDLMCMGDLVFKDKYPQCISLDP